MIEPSFVIQRPQGDYLTPNYLQWSVTLADAQCCGHDEAEAIQGWLAGIGIEVTITPFPAPETNFAQ